ncbi:hypothetical protein [Treponema sp. R80B11-R83G3]
MNIKKLFIIFFTFIIISNIYSDDNNFQLTNPSYSWGIDGFDVFWNAGSFSGEYNFLTNNFETSMTIINFFLEHQNTHIGMEFNIVKLIWDYYRKEENWIQNLHLLNLNLYWNPLDFDKIILGPFVSMNYITQNNDGVFDWNYITFRSGLRFFWRSASHDYYKIFFQKIGMEAGYENKNGINGFYVNINIDASISLLASLLYLFGVYIIY